MAFRISSNVASLSAQRSLEKSQRQSEKSLKALAAAQGSSQLETMRRVLPSPKGFAAMSGTKQARFNAQNAMSMVQTAEGGLNEQNNI